MRTPAMIVWILFIFRFLAAFLGKPNNWKLLKNAAFELLDLTFEPRSIKNED
jgi:hypothetical protein